MQQYRTDVGLLIRLDEYDEQCVLCGEWEHGPIRHYVPYYEEPVHQEIGTKLPNGDTVGGMSCCKACFDKHEAASPQRTGEE